MTTLSKGNKSIQISIENIICEPTNTDNHNISYIVQAPKIICNNKQDADYIHKKVNDYTMKLCKELLETKEDERRRK